MAVRRPSAGAPGQHFLRSSRLAAALVREAGVRPGDLVVDVGAGTGALTRPLAQAGATVIALELDRTLADRLASERITVVQADAATWPWPDREFAVVANLPFARCGAILAHLLNDPLVPLRRADVIVQWELAVKQTAVSPATVRSTYWRAWYELVLARRLSRTAFSPVPGVDAAVLRVVRRRQPLVSLARRDEYRTFLSDAFDRSGPPGRLGAVSRIEVKRLAPVLGFDPGARPRDLDAHQWAALFAATRPVP